MIKRILSSLYTRVFVAKKSSILALVVVAADALVSTLQAEALPSWAHTLVGIAASLLLLYKGSQPPAVQPVP